MFLCIYEYMFIFLEFILHLYFKLNQVIFHIKNDVSNHHNNINFNNDTLQTLVY